MSREHPFNFTDEIIEHALQLKESGLTWPVIAERLQCSVGCLRVTISKHKRGKIKGRYKESKERRTRIEVLVMEGKRPSDIARIIGISRTNLSNIFLAMGLNEEMRIQLRAQAARERNRAM